MTAISWEQAYADHAEKLFDEELSNIYQEFSMSKFATRMHREQAIAKALCETRLLNKQSQKLYVKLVCSTSD